MADAALTRADANRPPCQRVAVQLQAPVVAAAVACAVSAALAVLDPAAVSHGTSQGYLRAHVAVPAPSEVVTVAPAACDGRAFAHLDGAHLGSAVGEDLPVAKELAVVT
jgi:hypothetical protein